MLDFGRTTFGASCTGAAKFCLERATQHANQRVQFGETLGSFELVKDKLAYMAAGTFAMEAITYQTAALIDAGEDDYMLETAMLKVFATDVLWRIINDTIQIFGGKAYFTDEPYERMMRDGRINMIGEGANDVLRVFSALVGMRDVGLELKGVLDALMNPITNIGKIGGFASRRIGSLLSSPEVRVRSTELQDDATRLGRLVGSLAANVERLLRKYQESVLDRQYQLSARRRGRHRALRLGLRVESPRLSVARSPRRRSRAPARAEARTLLPADRRPPHPRPPGQPVGQRRRRHHAGREHGAGQMIAASSELPFTHNGSGRHTPVGIARFRQAAKVASTRPYLHLNHPPARVVLRSVGSG